MINPKIKRLIETTLPMVIGYGLVVLVATYFGDLIFGLIAIIIFSIIDVLMTRSQEIIPTHIKYEGKYYASLTELIKALKTKWQQK